jgi:hypothetical protein
MEVVRWLGFATGIVIVVATWGSTIRTLIVPSGESSRLTAFVGRRIVRGFFQWLANRSEDYEKKDRILALSAPMSLLAVLIAWLLSFLAGYALMIWPLADQTFGSALRQAGSSMLTLGFAATDTPAITAVDFTAGATGLVVVALQIAYLPTLYGSFNRRELLVTMLQSRAGAPAWGPEILVRTQVSDLWSEVPHFYAEWEQWAADVAETHSTYPVLVEFRSPHPLRSWIVGLTAVLDSAALLQAINPSSAPAQSRLAIRMGFTSLRYIADVLRIPYDPDPFPDDPIELTYEEFLGGIHRLEEAGVEMERTPEEAWEHFRGWRVNYESIAYAIADRVTAPPGPWSGPRNHLPGMAFVPERPIDRRPDSPEHREDPKAKRFGWRA